MEDWRRYEKQNLNAPWTAPYSRVSNTLLIACPCDREELRMKIAKWKIIS
jgi:hypothetical protein